MATCTGPANSVEELGTRVLTEPNAPPFDYERFLDRCLGNREFAARMLAKFQNLFVVEEVELAQAVLRADAETVARVAHRLKGSVATMSAGGLRDVLAAIEALGRAGQLAPLGQYLELLAMEWSRFLGHASQVSPLLADGPASPTHGVTAGKP